MKLLIIGRARQKGEAKEPRTPPAAAHFALFSGLLSLAESAAAHVWHVWLLSSYQVDAST